jgi:activator of 2-hydroxyglutaryl-CoA dehydratase
LTLPGANVALDRNAFRAIVIFGEAELEAFSEIKELVTRAVDSNTARVFDRIAPELFVAHGAALYAKYIQEIRDL